MLSCGCDYDDCEQKCDPHCTNVNVDGSPSRCPEMTDPGSNFGAGFYNDHHFHYGYFLYAIAVCAKLDPTSTWLAKYTEHALLYLRDIANPDVADPYFPTYRHMDWYAGFSWVCRP